MSLLSLTAPLKPLLNAKPQMPIVLGLYALALLCNEVALRLLDHTLLAPLFGLSLAAPQTRAWLGWLLVGVGSLGVGIGGLFLVVGGRAIFAWAKGKFNSPAALTRATVLNLLFLASSCALALALPGGILSQVFAQTLRIFVQLRTP